MNAGRQAAQNREAALRRVAIVLSSLPASVSAKLLAGVEDQKRNQLRRAMTSLADVDPLERKRAMQSFSGTVLERVSLAGSPDQAVNPQAATLDSRGHTGPGASSGSDPSQGDTSRDDPVVAHDHPLAFLNSVDDRQLVEILTSEHPQTGAMVLASIQPEKAASLLPSFPGHHRQELIRRLGRLGDIEPATLEDVAESLKARCLKIELPTGSSNGANALREIMSRMTVGDVSRPVAGAQTGAGENEAVPQDRFTRTAVDKAITSIDQGESPSTLNTAKRDEPSPDILPFPSQDLSTDEVNRRLESLPPTELCRCLGTVETREALLVLCGISMKCADKAIAMLPRPQQKETRKALAELGPLQLSEIDRAKERVAKASLRPSPAPVAA